MRRPAAAALLLAVCAAAVAGDGDMRVLTDEITERGDVGIDLQLDLSGRPRNPELEGRDALNGLFELSYGIADEWEASLQLPVVREGGRSYLGGANLEFQYVASHDNTQGPYCGIRIEIGYAGRPGEPRSWQTEWRPILGYRHGDWHGVLNAGLHAPVTGSERRVTFEPTVRLVRAVSRRSAAGFELEVDAGPLSHPLPQAQRREVLLAVFDTRYRKIDFTVGIGKGLNTNSDRIAAKLLASFELDD